MSKRTFDIGVDVDDILFPWSATVHDLSVKAGITNGRPYQTWHPWEDYGCTREMWIQVVQDAAKAGMYIDTPPYFGAVLGLLTLKHAGHRVNLVTARGTGGFAPEWFERMVKKDTVSWLDRFELPYDSLTFSKDKAIVNNDFFVDDNLGNYDALDAAGVEVWMVNRPHNAPWGDDRRRVKSFAEFVHVILAPQGVAV